MQEDWVSFRFVQVLMRVYHGEVPPAELEAFFAATEVSEDGSISHDSYLAAIDQMKQKAREYVHNT